MRTEISIVVAFTFATSVVAGEWSFRRADNESAPRTRPKGVEAPVAGGERLSGLELVQIAYSEAARENEVLVVWQEETSISGLELEVLRGGAPFVRGVCEGGRDRPNLSSAIFGLNYLFADGPEPPCPTACDADGDGSFNVADMVYVLNFLFASGPAPVGWLGSEPRCEEAILEECAQLSACTPPASFKFELDDNGQAGLNFGVITGFRPGDHFIRLVDTERDHTIALPIRVLPEVPFPPVEDLKCVETTNDAGACLFALEWISRAPLPDVLGISVNGFLITPLLVEGANRLVIPNPPPGSLTIRARGVLTGRFGQYRGLGTNVDCPAACE